jgi:hypothetical protein
MEIARVKVTKGMGEINIMTNITSVLTTDTEKLHGNARINSIA